MLERGVQTEEGTRISPLDMCIEETGSGESHICRHSMIVSGSKETVMLLP